MLKHSDETSESATNNPSKLTWFRKRGAETTGAVVTSAPASVDARISNLRVALAGRKRIQFINWCAIAGITSAFSALIHSTATWTPPTSISHATGLFLPIGMLVCGEAVLLTNVIRGERRLRAAVNAVSGEDDVRAAGPLAEAAILNTPARAVAAAAMLRILQRIADADSATIGETDIASLSRAYRFFSDRRRLFRRDPELAAQLRQALVTLKAGSIYAEAKPIVQAKSWALEPEAVRALVVKAVEDRKRNLTFTAASALVGAGAGLSGVALQAHGSTAIASGLLYLAMAAVATTVASSIFGAYTLNAAMRSLVRGSTSADRSIAGPLLEIAAVPDTNTQSMATMLLTRILPSLRIGDRDVLSTPQYEALIRSLTTNADSPAYLEAALKALEQIGDGAAIPAVERLKAGSLVNSERARVIAAATECLPYLQARLDEARASSTLLRGAAAEATPPAQLLRPADGAAATDADLLQSSLEPDEREDVTGRYEFAQAAV